MENKLKLNEKIFNLQNEIGKISKDSKNPFYNSKYFDINTLLKQLHPILCNHRLLLTQPIVEGMVVTRITCLDSNLSIDSSLELPEIMDPQKKGSAITYYRRYTLVSLLGLQAEDDDGNLAHTAIKKNKPILTDEKFNKAVNYLKEGKVSLQDIKSKYKASDKVWKELEQLIN